MTDQRIYWDEEVPEPTLVHPAKLPRHADVVVIGAGYTGLSTAFHLAQSGRRVVVLEAGRIGAGCSSRNGGMVGPSFHKLGTSGLIAKYGDEKTLGIMREGILALDYFEAFVKENKLACDYQPVGRFRGARTAADYESTARECDWLGKNLGLPTEMVPQSDQRAQIGTDFYRGGVIYHRDGGIHPRKLVLELARVAQEAGATILPECAVSGWDNDATGLNVKCARGVIHATEIVVATNAYADKRTQVMSSRMVPIETAAVATEELSADVMAELTPLNRMHGESGRVFMWYRPTPDRKRFIFGGRMGVPGASEASRMAAFRKAMLRVFPQLASVSFSHFWAGYVAYTTDHSPHIGHHDGVWVAGGYCGSGVTRSLYFGMKLARKILRQPDRDTAFDDLPFEAVPFRRLAPHGALAMTQWYAYQDARELRQRDKV
ncbi:NAD(P)/FAD-dependent oxidoreductase [Heliomarina baculiformis]|uniref:NAD(P)/FAD-dependent oxidoreductase n=1 Tax=Heliomarina baculiformis TaxID=2872036 RepID=UPI001EE34B1A|nr:FAD-binding oxidoreductase [Heliomarina baculiformis]